MYPDRSVNHSKNQEEEEEEEEEEKPRAPSEIQ